MKLDLPCSKRILPSHKGMNHETQFFEQCFEKTAKVKRLVFIRVDCVYVYF